MIRLIKVLIMIIFLFKKAEVENDEYEDNKLWVLMKTAFKETDH
jgi:hypothetical protein